MSLKSRRKLKTPGNTIIAYLECEFIADAQLDNDELFEKMAFSKTSRMEQITTTQRVVNDIFSPMINVQFGGLLFI